MKGLDILGNIAIAKFSRDERKSSKIRQAREILKKIRSISTVLEKSGKFQGRLRLQKTKYLAGKNTKEVLCRENGCIFRFNADKCYFSPRLANERQEIANQISKKESVLVMFGGVAPFAIVIAKKAKPEKIASVEISRVCNNYARENVRRNKVNVEIIQGDARRILPKMKEKFDRIIMTRPNLKDTFLDVAFPRVKKRGIIHYYGFCREDELEEMLSKIRTEAKKAGKKIKILKVKKAGDIGIRTFRFRIDLRVA